MSMERFPEIDTWPSKGGFMEIERTVRAMTRDLEKKDGIHGDFWTGNMILKDKPLPIPSNTNAVAAAALKD